MGMKSMIVAELEGFVDPEKAIFYPKFFKTGPGEYGEGDRFMGVTVPNQRRIAKKYYKKLSPKEVIELLRDSRHECRLTALFILVLQYDKSTTETERQQIVDIYLENISFVNNWDLVDSSAYHILGRHLWDKDRALLYEFAASDDLWKERISIIATYYFIRQNDFDDALKLTEQFLSHPHDLIHKAAGWMLREVAKRDVDRITQFLDQHCTEMPRTMLRYSIERFDEDLRQSYLKR